MRIECALYLPAITLTVSKLVESPCLSNNETVDSVPVDGDQVRFHGWPASTVVGMETMVNGFAPAATQVARAAMAKELMNCILKNPKNTGSRFL